MPSIVFNTGGMLGIQSEAPLAGFLAPTSTVSDF